MNQQLVPNDNDPAWREPTSLEERLRPWALEVVAADENGPARLGFFGVPAIARQELSIGAGATVDDVIAILQRFGLVRQAAEASSQDQ